MIAAMKMIAKTIVRLDMFEVEELCELSAARATGLLIADASNAKMAASKVASRAVSFFARVDVRAAVFDELSGVTIASLPSAKMLALV